MPTNRSHPVNEAAAARKRGDADVLLRLLTDTDIVARRTAAYNLGKMRSARAIPDLLRCLHARDELLRSTALAALGEIREPSAIPAIFESATQDVSFRVRTTAVEALIDLGDERRAISLLGVMLTEERVPHRRSFRKWALRRLIELNATKAIPDLRAAERGAGVAGRFRIRRAIKRLEAVQGKESPLT